MKVLAWLRSAMEKLLGRMGQRPAAEVTGVPADPEPTGQDPAPAELADAGQETDPGDAAQEARGGSPTPEKLRSAAIAQSTPGMGADGAPEDRVLESRTPSLGKRQYMAIRSVGTVRHVAAPTASPLPLGGLHPETPTSRDVAVPAQDAYRAISWTGNKPGRLVDVENLLSHTRRKGLLNAAQPKVKMGQATGSGLAERQELDEEFFALLAGEVNRALRLRIAELRNIPKLQTKGAPKGKPTPSAAKPEPAIQDTGKDAGAAGQAVTASTPSTAKEQE